MSFCKPCHLPFRKLILPFTLTAVVEPWPDLIPQNELLILDEKMNIIERRVWYKKLLQLVKFYGDYFPTP